jgi:competence protein ComEC
VPDGKVGAMLGALAAAAMLVGGGGERDAAAPRLCLEVLDVGQGDALLLSLPGGERWLVDGGGDPAGRVDVGQRLLLPALRRRGVEGLERVFATHGDLDHTGGRSAVLGELEVGELWLPRRSGASRSLQRLISDAERRGIPVRSVEGGDPLRSAAPARAVVLHPSRGWVDALNLDADENNGSIVLHVALGDVGMLLTGDVEGPAEELLVARGLPRAAVLKVPHHGSRSSSSASLLAAVDPLVALTGAGRENRFGFPHASVSARYLLRGVPFLWTGRHGALRACTDGWGLDVEGAPRGGRWRRIRSWDAADVRAWAERSGGAPVPAVARPPQPHEPRRTSRSHRRPPKPRVRARSARPPKPTPEPTPPVLLDDRTWEKHRRKRHRPRPPWKR